MSISCSVLDRRHAQFLFENAIEIGVVMETAHSDDAGDGTLGIAQQLTGAFQANRQDETRERSSGFLLDEHGQVFGMVMKGRSNLIHRKGVG